MTEYESFMLAMKAMGAFAAIWFVGYMLWPCIDTIRYVLGRKVEKWFGVRQG